MEAPEHIVASLRNIRSGFNLRWNPRAVLRKAGGYDATGKLKDPEYDPRYELWDTDPDGLDYMVMRLQGTDGSFRPPGEWLVTHIGKVNPERYPSYEAMVAALVDEPEVLREVGTQKDSDDLIDAVARWAEWCEKPHSGAAIQHRGKRLLSA